MGQWKIVLNSEMIEEAQGDWQLAALIGLLRNEQETNYDTDHYIDDEGERWFRFSTKTMLNKLHGMTEKQLKPRLKKCSDMGIIRTCNNWQNPFDQTRLIHVDKMYYTIGTKSTVVNGTKSTVDNKEQPLRTTFKSEKLNFDKNDDNPLNKKPTTHTGGFFPEDVSCMDFLKTGAAKDEIHLYLRGIHPKLNEIGYFNLINDFYIYARATRKPWVNENAVRNYFSNWAKLRKWEDIKQPAERVIFEPMPDR